MQKEYNPKNMIIIDGSFLNSIDQHCLSNKSSKLSMKNHQVVTTSKLCKPLQHEGKLMQSLYTSEQSI